MVTLAVLMILLGLGVPQLNTFLERRAVMGQAETVVSALQLARSEAMKRGESVILCNSANPDATSPACTTAAANWSTGWLVYVDRDGTNGFGGSDILIKVQQAMRASSLTRNGINATAVTFTRDGLAVGEASSFMVRPNVSGNGANQLARCVVLSNQGRTRMSGLNAQGQCA